MAILVEDVSDVMLNLNKKLEKVRQDLGLCFYRRDMC